jgi:hypothetical protein
MHPSQLLSWISCRCLVGPRLSEEHITWEYILRNMPSTSRGLGKRRQVRRTPLLGDVSFREIEFMFCFATN